MNSQTPIKAVVLGLAALFGAIVAAKAVPMNITVDSAGNLLFGVGLSVKDNNYPSNSNDPASNFTFLQQEVGYYNSTHNPDLTAPVSPVAADFGALGGVTSYVAVAGYEYVVLHFGNGEAQYPTGNTIPAHWEKVKGQNVWVLEAPELEKPTGGWWSAWYLGGASVQFSLPNLNGDVGGFSSARYYNKLDVPPPMVPEDGSTMLLLGSALISVAVASRRGRKA